MKHIDAPRFHWRNRAAIAAAYLLAVLLAANSWHLPGLVALERLAYDLRLAQTAAVARQDERILLVTFDEATVAATKRRSPLGRKTLGDSLQVLDKLSPRAIGVDILLDQPTTEAEDTALARALSSLRTSTWLAGEGADQALLKPWQRQSLHEFLEHIGNPRVQVASATLFADSDDVVRRSAPSGVLTLPDALAQAFGAATRKQELPINYRRPADPSEPVFTQLPVLSLTQASPAALAALRPLVTGRLVLVGADLENYDLHRTPLSLQTGSAAAGLDIQAHILSTLLDAPRGWAPGRWLFWLLVMLPPALGAFVGSLRLPAAALIAAVIGGSAALLLASVALEAPPGIQTYGLPIMGAALSWLGMVLVTGAITAATTTAERNLAREIAKRYLPPDVARQIERRPELLGVHGRRLPLAIVFTDLAGFTTLSEGLRPEELGQVLNGYLDGMTEAALRHGATLDKFIGDAVVCFWGAPIADGDAARNAIAGALAMQAFAKRHRDSLRENNILIGETRIGLHYGEAVVGNFGSRLRVQYTAMGDAMNLAARLESANKQLATQLLASEQIVEQAGWTRARDMGWIAVKGRTQPCRVYELDNGLTDAAADQHRAIVQRLREAEPGAEDAMSQRLLEAPEDIALAGLARRGRSVGWKGVWFLESK